jgi:1-phosphatidylinositol phosphodiesterase
MGSGVKCAVLTVVLAAAGCAIGFAPVIGPAPYGGGLEFSTNRGGSDYRSFDLGVPRPEDCRNACLGDPACAAFTYVNPGVQGPNARCWLKNAVPPPSPDGCCVSGVKYASAPPPPPPQERRPFERGIDRNGSDYRSFDLPAPNPEICRESCYGEPQCVAFTYVHPGIQGPNARCWLKNSVPPARPSGCCISGVK